MLSIPRCIKLGTLLWAGGAAALALYLAGSGPSARLLAASEMSDVARGAAPAPCTHILINTTCGDMGKDNVMPCRFRGKPRCMRACAKCTNVNAPHSYYTNKFKPWNVHLCQPGGQAGGCGVVVTGAKCQWDAQNQVCVCVGGQPLPEEPCFQGQPHCQFDCVPVP